MCVCCVCVCACVYCVCKHACAACMPVCVCACACVCVHACVYLLSQLMGAGAKTLVAHCLLSQGVVHWFSGSPGNHLCKYPAHKSSRQDLNKQLNKVTQHVQLFWLTAMMCVCVLCVCVLCCVCVVCVCMRVCVIKSAYLYVFVSALGSYERWVAINNLLLLSLLSSRQTCSWSDRVPALKDQFYTWQKRGDHVDTDRQQSGWEEVPSCRWPPDAGR